MISTCVNEEIICSVQPPQCAELQRGQPIAVDGGRDVRRTESELCAPSSHIYGGVHPVTDKVRPLDKILAQSLPDKVKIM